MEHVDEDSVLYMNDDVDESVKQLRAAGTDLSKQVPALLELGGWYLREAKRTSNGPDFTKANALYNAALVRSRRVNHEIGEDQILRRIVETYRTFLYALADDNEDVSVDEIRNEIDRHKEFVASERRIIKKRVDEIDSCFNENAKTNEKYEVRANQVQNIFRDIQDMYIRLVSMLARECERKLGKLPCNYCIIALGSVARMEATPFSDLEFAILYSDADIGEKMNYFRIMSHFIHLKVINLGETVLPALAIEQLNDFQSSDPNSNWFYDSGTPRGISFDGAMPWASKTPLGRMATTNKPALELIKTPEEMAKFQDEEIAVKEGYHLADILSRAVLLHGNEALLNEYNSRVTEKQNEKSSAMEGKPTQRVGVIRGMQQMMADIETFGPCIDVSVGSLFDAKKEFYRLISLLLSDLGLILNIRTPSPWRIILELKTKGIITVSESVNIKVCLSIANEVRMKTYFANNGQKELFSPVAEYANHAEQSAEVPIFRDFNEDMLVRLLSTSSDLCERCRDFFLKWVQDDEIDCSVFQKVSLETSKEVQLGYLYLRLQHLHKALEWMRSAPKNSSDYGSCLNGLGHIYLQFVELDKSIDCFEEALQWHYQNEKSPHLVLHCINNLARALLFARKFKMATVRLEEAICKHKEIYGEESHTLTLMLLMENLGYAYSDLGNVCLAVKILKAAEEMQRKFTTVSDENVINLNIYLALSLSKLDRHEQALEYMEQAIRRSHKLYGVNNLSINLARVYNVAGLVHCRKRSNKAVSFFERSLEFHQQVFSDSPHHGKIEVLVNLGIFFGEINQTDKAVEHFESALQQAKSLYGDKPHMLIVEILTSIGKYLGNSEMYRKSLPYIQEAKEIVDQIHGAKYAHPITSSVLFHLGTNYLMLSDNFRALQCFQDAYDINCTLYGEDALNSCCGNMEAVCMSLAFTAQLLGNFTTAKEYYAKTVKIKREAALAKKAISSVTHALDIVSCLFYQGGCSEALGEQKEALALLEEAKAIATDADLKDWVVVDVLVQLIKKYAEKESIFKSIMCYVEAGQIAINLPRNKSLSPSTMKMLKLMKI